MSEFSFSDFLKRFPTDAVCLEEIKKIRYVNGVHCRICNKITKHYRLQKRNAYSCKYCRNQIYPLAQTIFEKSSTPLRTWFYALFLMSYTRGTIRIKRLQKELGVTYKTAWRMYKNIHLLMEQNNGDLLASTAEINTVVRWTFFNKFELTLTEKKETNS